jgi:hypothetical protein
MFPWDFNPTIYNPTYPVPLLFLLSLTSVLSLRIFGTVTKVKYTLFLFSPFSEQRPIWSLKAQSPLQK